MPRLIRIDTGDEIGSISDSQLQFLVSQLEEENDDDRDVHLVDRDTLELLSDNGCEPDLMTLLEKGLGDDDEMSISWD
ncbi:MAG TPA: hypothetical protein VLX92_33625 [Kofleriaceae bacterium]|nr:hypothetical protein [Kofleriaceae bacterium]